MIRHSLAVLPSTADCLKLIDTLLARFSKDHQRKPTVDLTISTTYSADPKEVASVHEVTLMVDDKTQKATPSTRLASEVAWFRGQEVAS